MAKIDNNALFFANFIDADLKLVDLQDYLNNVSKFIDRKRKHKERTYKENVLKEIAIKMFTESFTSMLFKSTLISAWVFMEAELKGYCNAMQTAMGIDLPYSDLKGSAIEKFKVYTSKVLSLDFKLKDEDWESFKAINEIRNSIVHSEGNVGNKRLVNSFLKRNKLPQLPSNGRASIDKDVLSIIITICRLLVERIYVVALYKFPGQYSPKEGSNE